MISFCDFFCVFVSDYVFGLFRKRYIGNDLTCVVFLDPDHKGPFVPPTISGDFLRIQDNNNKDPYS
jgi:hypothetical protein